MFKKILVPVDGSEPSVKALTFALELAAWQKSGVRFCHIPIRSKAHEIAEHVPFSREAAGSQWDDVQQSGRAILDAARYRAQELGVTAETSMHAGSPADAIVELAARDGVDLIVMGSHGYEGPVRAVVSSTAETVIRRASVPVIVVGPKAVWDLEIAAAQASS